MKISGATLYQRRRAGRPVSQEHMGTTTKLGVTAVLMTALIAAAAHKRHTRLPADFRDAMADTSALEEKGDAGTEMPDIPQPAPARAGNEASVRKPEKGGPGHPLSTAYSVDDILRLIASTGEGSSLLGRFQAGEAELPEIVHRSRLTGADAEAARGAAITHEENRVALFIKGKGFRDNRPHIIFYKADWPLFAAACVTAHELQHALDQGAPWYRRLTGMRKETTAKLAKANSRGYLLLEDLALEDLGYGLGYMKTFFSEYLAYSRSSAVFKDLSRSHPELKGRLSSFKRDADSGKSIVEYDPLNDPRDRRDFMDRYFWPGNRPRFKAGVLAVLKDKELLAALKEAKLDEAVSQLAALYDTPDPVYAPVHSLR